MDRRRGCRGTCAAPVENSAHQRAVSKQRTQVGCAYRAGQLAMPTLADIDDNHPGEQTVGKHSVAERLVEVLRRGGTEQRQVRLVDVGHLFLTGLDADGGRRRWPTYRASAGCWGIDSCLLSRSKLICRRTPSISSFWNSMALVTGALAHPGLPCPLANLSPRAATCPISNRTRELTLRGKILAGAAAGQGQQVDIGRRSVASRTFRPQRYDCSAIAPQNARPTFGYGALASVNSITSATKPGDVEELFGNRAGIDGCGRFGMVRRRSR